MGRVGAKHDQGKEKEQEGNASTPTLQVTAPWMSTLSSV